MFRLLLSCLAALVISAVIFAQNNSGIVYGSVEDEASNNPIPFVNVILLNTIDSSVVKGVSADNSGKFQITNIPDGDYLLRFSCIGFREVIRTSIKISPSGRRLNTGTTMLSSFISDLDEVVITGKKQVFNNSIDRKIYNVDKDIMSKSGSASDLLQNIPSVSVDIDGNVSLRGSQNCMIMINGKTSPLMEKSSAAVLEELPSNLIERIEVITNPSASFKPDGTSGIINIVLKKDAKLGINSNITLNIGNNSRYNGNINFNYNPGSLNIFGNYGYRHDYRARISSENRIQTDSFANKEYLTESNIFSGRPLAHLATLGFEYTLDKNNKLSLSGNYFYHDAERSGIDAQLYTNNSGSTQQDFDRLRLSTELEKEYDGQFSYNHSFDEEDHELEIEAKYSGSTELESNDYTENYRYPVVVPRLDKDALTQKQYSNELSLKYKYPFNEKSTFEAGYLGEFESSILDNAVKYYDYNVNSFLYDLGKSSSFHLKSSSNALYSTFKNEVGRFGYMAGLRAENVVLQPELITLNNTYSNKYFSLFPTLHLKYKLTETSSLQLNYSRRIHRPHDDDLNPFPEYDDPRNLRTGNPNLKPEYINSLEFGYHIDFENVSLIPGIYYRYTTNRFTQITRPLSNEVLITTPMNLSNDRAGGLELVVSSSVNNTFSLQLSLNGFYNQIDASNIGYVVKTSAYSWNGTLNFNYNITRSTVFQINSNYRSIRLTPQGKSEPSYSVNCGVSQSLLNDKISLIFTISDLFNTMKYKNTLDTSNLYDYSVRSREGRIMYFGITYHFGKHDKKEKMEYEDSL